MTPRWERRFRAPMITHPDWSPSAPSRLAYESTESGVWQLHVADLDTGVRRRVTDHPVGVVSGAWSPDGAEICWWQDETGDESGPLVRPAVRRRRPATPVPASSIPAGTRASRGCRGCSPSRSAAHDGFAVLRERGRRRHREGGRPEHRAHPGRRAVRRLQPRRAVRGRDAAVSAARRARRRDARGVAGDRPPHGGDGRRPRG